MSVYGGAAGYRPRVQPAYCKRLYHHSWQASRVNIGSLKGNGIGKVNFMITELDLCI